MLYTQLETDLALGTLDGIVRPESLENVRQHYEGDGRYYHDFDHAVEVVSWINRACEDYTEEALHPFTHQELRLAALFHDVVYTAAGSPSNEQQSCELMRNELKGVVSEESLAQIGQLIMLTAQHGKLGAGDAPLAGCVLLDADIASLGQYHWETVVYNNMNVVAELRLKYTPEQVALGRKAFLGGLLAKKSIFLSEFFRTRLEDQARRNITKILASS